MASGGYHERGAEAAKFNVPPDLRGGYDYSGARLGKRRKPGAVEPDSAFLQSVVPTGHNNSVIKQWLGVVTRDGWKYVCFENTSWMLHNLNDDPYERMNLAHNNGSRAERKRLLDRLKQWMSDTGDKFPLPAD